MKYLFILLTIFLVLFYTWIYFYVPELAELLRIAEIELTGFQLWILNLERSFHSPKLIYYGILPFGTLVITILLFLKSKLNNNINLKYNAPWFTYLSRIFITLCLGVMMILIYGAVSWHQQF